MMRGSRAKKVPVNLAACGSGTGEVLGFFLALDLAGVVSCTASFVAGLQCIVFMDIASIFTGNLKTTIFGSWIAPTVLGAP